MKIAGPLLLPAFLVGLLAGPKAVSAADNVTLAAAMSVSRFDQLIPEIQAEFFPGLIRAINNIADDELTARASSGSCCGFRDRGVRAEARIFNFRINQNAGLSIDVVPVNNRRARLRIEATNLVLRASASAGVGAAFIVGQSHCIFDGFHSW